MKACLTLILALVASNLVAADDQYALWKKAYPPAEAGRTRHVLNLPKQEDEYAFKVELIVGKTIETDGVNNVFFGGAIKEKNVEGWGYPRYDVTVGPTASTLIGVPPGQPPVAKFVTVGVGPHLFRYNSKLPVVVYAPEGYEVRYRVWKADAETKPVPTE